jgi:hypothetical protein
MREFCCERERGSKKGKLSFQKLIADIQILLHINFFALSLLYFFSSKLDC